LIGFEILIAIFPSARSLISGTISASALYGTARIKISASQRASISVCMASASAS
jgi:hypothetical protein